MEERGEVGVAPFAAAGIVVIIIDRLTGTRVCGCGE